MAQSTARFFHRLAAHPALARPVPPNDHPHIEAFFSMAENVPGYPGRLLAEGLGTCWSASEGNRKEVWLQFVR